jgi:predicted transcriptional regulator
MTTTTTSLRLPVDLLATFDRLAETLGRHRSTLMIEALQDYAERESRWQAEMERRIAAADQGDFVSDEEMEAWWATHSTREERTRARREVASDRGLAE